MLTVLLSIAATLVIVAAVFAIYNLFGMFQMLGQYAQIANTNVEILDQLRAQQEAAMEENGEPIGLL